MRKKLLLAIALSYSVGILSAQTFRPSADKLYQSLIDDVYIFAVFVDTQDDYWEEEEKEYYYQQLLISQAWLVEQASLYGQYLNFENDYFLDNREHVYLEDVRRGQSPKYTVNQALMEIGYDDFDDFLYRNSFDFENNKLKMVFFVKKYDRSHAYNYFSNKDLDLAIVYCRSTIGLMTNHFVISHEILHQFGAWDLYYGKSQTRETAQKAKELYPNSIMINTRTNLAELEVDDLTAWRIGWHYDYQEGYDEFDPNKRSKEDKKEAGGTSIKFDLKGKKDKQ